MTLEESLSFLTKFIYALVAAVTLVDWLRHRDRTRLDIALVFISLTATTIVQSFQSIIGVESLWLNKLGSLAVISQPYFLLRLAQYFRPVRKLIQRAALLGLVFSWVALILYSQPLSLPVTLFLIVYFVLVEVYATYILVQGALTIRGITGKRLRLASAGSGLLAFLFIVGIVLLLFRQAVAESPALQSGSASLIQVLAILSGLSYYFGFAPPRWLMRSWQLHELHRFLQQVLRRQEERDQASTFQQLSASAIRTVGGAVAVIAYWDPAAKHLKIEISDEPSLQVENLETESAIIARAWRQGRGLVANVPHDMGPKTTRWAEQIGAQTLFIVPIMSSLRPWGLLIVALRYTPLFAQDDLDMLILLAEQSTIPLDYDVLITGLQGANQSLEQRVVERTTQLVKTNQELEAEIAERRRTEEALKYSEERLHAIIEQSPLSIQVFSPDGTYIRANPAWEKLWGARREQLIGYNVLADPQVKARDILPYLQKAFAGELVVVPPVYYDPADTGQVGKSRWTTAVIYPVKDAAGQIREVVLTHEDITERWQAEEALQKAHAELEFQVQERTAALSQANSLLQTLMDNMPDHIYFKDADSRFIRNSKSQSKMMGLSDPAALVGKTDFDFLPKDHAQRSYDEEQKLMKSDQPLLNSEEYVVWPDGTSTWVSTTKLPLRDTKDNVIGTFGISRDITARKHVEKELQKSNTQLEAANQELEAFSYSVSHDLRAPLRAIDGFSQAVLEDYGETLPDQGRDYLTRVRVAAQRMANLIDDMLNLSRVTRAPLRSELIDISKLAADIYAELQQSDPERRVKFTIAKNLKAKGDPQLMRAVLDNLIGNAWKFTSRETKAEIELGSKHENEESIYFIRDNGAGFDMAYADKLFGAFQRLHSTAEFPGTGIGLATVQRIIHRHGGRVWAESVLGEGTTFFFTLG